MTPKEQRIVRDLVKRIRAQDKFLVAYRTGGKPSEKAFQDVRTTANAVNEAEEMLIQSAVPPSSETTEKK